mmetsp:Transcript_15238/g.18634  ORF Transcript_15238/g.18634 Transcript_15238/m.18634 type:complete len:187 (-) Transcript_15238:14-574(-)
MKLFFFLFFVKVYGIGPIQGPNVSPMNLPGTINRNGEPLNEVTINSRDLQPKCSKNTLYALAKNADGEPSLGTKQSNWADYAKIGEFSPECAACVAKALTMDGQQGCPAPSLAWTYECYANELFTYAFCQQIQSKLYLWATASLPFYITLWIGLWISCLKISVCPGYYCVNYCRRRRGRKKSYAWI